MIKRPIKGPAVEDLTVVRFPCIGFPKIDGFRCILHLSKGPLTSRLSPFPNRHFRKKLTGLMYSDKILDGEVVCGDHKGKGVLGRTSSGLTSEDGKPDWHLWVFDAPLINCGFEGRYNLAEEMVKNLGHKRIHLLQGRWLNRFEDLEAYVEKCLADGFEGVITRDPEGEYKEGKSTLRQQHMLKIKPFIDAEGRITGWYEEEKNNNEAKREVTGKLKRSSAKSGKTPKGRLGGFILEDCETGVEVRVGGGFTHYQRKRIWEDIQRDSRSYIGKLVKYKKQKIGEKDKPRHPGFKEFIGWRPEWDYAE